MLPVISPVMNAGANMYGVRHMHVVSMVVQTAGTYGDQWLRPLAPAPLSGTVVNMVENALAQNRTLDPMALAQPALSFLAPGVAPETAVPIVNGWGTARYRFILEIEVVDTMGCSTNHYYTGFSEFSDNSYSGHIDPNVKFQICNHTSVKRVPIETPVGMQEMRTPIGNHQILAPTNYTGLTDPNKIYSLRPETVINGVMLQPLKSGAPDMFLSDSDFINTPTASLRKNNSPPDYLARVLSTYRNSAVSAATMEYEHQDQTLENVKRVLESDTETDYFLIWLQHRRMRSMPELTAMLSTNQFTINDLLALDSTCMPRIRNADTINSRGGMHQRGGSSEWSDRTKQAQMASLLLYALPSYMNSFQFGFINLHATNRTITGEIQMAVVPKSFNSKLDIRPQIQAFEQRFKTEILRSISEQNRMPFDLEITCDLYGETWIHVGLMDQPRELFVAPTFCDSLFSPTMTRDHHKLDALSNDFSELFRMIDSSVNVSSMASGGGFSSPSLTTPAAPAIVSMPSPGFSMNNPGF